MTQHAEKDSGPVLALDGDPRITFIGYLLRTTRFDELPQLFNVIKGDMSLVGPRPERPFFVEQYIHTIPSYAYRMSVKPGITGYAQVNGTYRTKVEEKLAYDLYYIQHHSLWLDIKILSSTLLVVLNREKAKGFKSPLHRGDCNEK
jgi:lipopolysaccharide/colanic/teichoic acid biosynthesis glycosyltransferase